MGLQPLTVIETSDPTWSQRVHTLLASGKNFFILVPDGSHEILGRQIPVFAEYPFRSLEKFVTYLFKTELEEADFLRLLKARQQDAGMYFIEQKGLRLRARERFIV